MREVKDQFDSLGAVVIGVGTKEAYQAQKLLDGGMPFPLLLDPENQIRSAIGAADKLRGRALLSPKGALRYVRALGQRKDYGLVASEALNRPAVLVLDAEQNVTFSHVGQRLGDYPEADRVLAEVRAAAASKPHR